MRRHLSLFLDPDEILGNISSLLDFVTLLARACSWSKSPSSNLLDARDVRIFFMRLRVQIILRHGKNWHLIHIWLVVQIKTWNQFLILSSWNTKCLFTVWIFRNTPKVTYLVDIIIIFNFNISPSDVFAMSKFLGSLMKCPLLILRLLQNGSLNIKSTFRSRVKFLLDRCSLGHNICIRSIHGAHSRWWFVRLLLLIIDLSIIALDIFINLINYNGIIFVLF